MDDQEVGPAGLLELTHHEAPGSGSGLPMDVAAIITGDVLAQGVEGHVRAGQVLGDGAFDVSDEADRRRVQVDGARVDEQVDRLGPVL